MDLTIVTVAPKKDRVLKDIWLAGVKRWFPGAKVIMQPADQRFTPGSNQHAAGLNAAMKKVTTEHVLILDLDCVVLSNKWWSPKITVLGGRKPAGANTMHMAFLCGRTEIFKSYDFMPKSPRPTADTDVGSELGLLNADLEFRNCKKGGCKHFDKTYQVQEIYYRNKLIACHYGRGSNLSGKVQKTDKPLSDQYSMWLQRMYLANRK